MQKELEKHNKLVTYCSDTFQHRGRFFYCVYSKMMIGEDMIGLFTVKKMFNQGMTMEEDFAG